MLRKTTRRINYRTGPGKSYKKIGVLPKNTVINVIETKGSWVKFKHGNKLYFASSVYTVEVVDYGAKVVSKIEPAAKEVVSHLAKHTSGSYSFTGPKVNCSVFVSYILQKAGILPKGITVYHTSKTHSKGTLNDVVKNRTKVKHYNWYKTNDKYSKLPAKYKKPGCIYLYPSSVAILGKSGYIYGCHNSGKTYNNLGMIKHKSGYEFDANILAVGVPKTE